MSKRYTTADFKDADLELAVIGNSAFSALVDKKGSIVWSCFPRFDGDPIFCSLIKKQRTGPQAFTRGSDQNDIGFFDVQLAHFQCSEQEYIRNSAVLSTRLYDVIGNAVEIKDFIPCFPSYDRDFRPMSVVRMITPLKGRPRIQIRLRPTFGYGWGTPEKTRGSNHIRYLLSTNTIRLTTNAPISYIVEEVFFEVVEPLYLLLMPDESMKSSIEETAITFLANTLKYWKNWIQSLTIPFEWQDEVIRACITLKLNNFEETGAIVAAQTSSIPSSPTSTTNFDYRYCWLRDAYAVVRVLNELGATNTLSNYLKFLSNIVSDLKESNRLQSVYGICLEDRLHEREMHRLTGYRGKGPVVLGNQDAEKIQHDVYGEVILALTQTFFDRRLANPGTEVLFHQLEELGEKAIQYHDQPGSTRSKAPAIFTFSSVMCWAACDRLAKIAKHLKIQGRELYWKSAAEKLHDSVMENSWNEDMKSFTNIWGGSEVDANLLVLPQIGFIDANDPKFLGTLEWIERVLKRGDYLAISADEDIAHNPATFWYIHTLASIGRMDEARYLFEIMLNTLNRVGLLSETVEPSTRELWGNFPQSISMVGLIDCAIRLSKPWKVVL